MATKTPEERFRSKVDRVSSPNGCWLWTGANSGYGYGRMWVDGRMVGAHRFSYEQTHGGIPAGMYIDHKCHVPLCVNPEHLQIVTNKQNQENQRGACRTSRSGIRGVSWYRASGKWKVSVRHHGRDYHGGLFTDIAEAEQAAIDLRLRLFTNNLVDTGEAISA